MSKWSKKTIAAAVLLLSVNGLFASEAADKELISFIKSSIRQGDGVVLKDVSIASTSSPKFLGGWEAVIMKMDFSIKGEEQTRYEVVFRSGRMVSFDMMDMQTKRSIKPKFSPPLDISHYKADRIIAGDASGKAKHKIVVFSDPLCPFCLDLVPDIIKFAQANPKDVSLYFYHFPIASIHPSSPLIIKAAIALELQGYKDVVGKLYGAEFNYKVTDPTEVLKNFNNHFGSHVTLDDVQDPKVLAHYKEDSDIAAKLMISGTPSVFVDGDKDMDHTLFENLKKTLK